jgi:hypothetical protein
MPDAAPHAPAKQLSPAPPHLVESGAPREGLFSGTILDPRFDALSGPFAKSLVERRFTEKKWQYVFVAGDEVMLTLALIDIGYLSSGFCAVFDRGSRRLLADLNPVLPPLLAWVGDAPGDAHLRGPGVKAAVEKNGDRWSIRASWAHVEIDLLLDAAKSPPPLSAVASVGEAGRFDYTQKNTLLVAEGEIYAGNNRFPLSGAPAGLDYTHGLLRRETSWRWAFCAGPRVAFNLSDGFLKGDGENVAWIGGAPRPVGPVQFEYDAKAPVAPWRIRGDNVDLTFKPEGLRRQDVDLKLILSRYVQPFGTFEGQVLGEKIEGLAGVSEDHAARW